MNEKNSLRAMARTRRATLAQEMPDHAARIAAFAGELGVASASIVGGYVALKDEADPDALLKRLAAAGCRICLPRVAARGEPLGYHVWEPGRILVRGAFGVPEPEPDWPLATPTVLLVPLLAFDAEGHRLGYGGGYYDRTLESLRRGGPLAAIGVGFAGQEVPLLPRQWHDQPLDMIVTELGVRRFARP